MPVKLLRSSVLWGTAVAVAFVAVTMVLVFKFPNFRLPFSFKHGAAILASAALSLLLIASYRKLWKRLGFWALLFAFLGAYWLVVVYLAGQFGGLRMDAVYGITAAIEVALFGNAMARLYHQGPEVPSWIGPGTR